MKNVLDDKFIVSVKVGPKGQITIPVEARNMFDIKTGDTLMVIGDKNRGIAIAKADDFYAHFGFDKKQVTLMNIVETQNLTKVYGGRAVVNKVNMHIPEGSIYGFVGENGSGKTTIMRMLTGIARPTEGSFEMFGVKNTDPKIYRKRKEISAIVETVSLVPTMTAIDNMKYQELYLGIKLTNERRQELLQIVGLDKVGNKKVKNFSLGMRQRMGIALALMNEPKFMLLDEPMNGLDPQGIAELRDILIKVNREKHVTILISSHILSELEKIATVYGFISHGKIIEELTVEELQDRCRKSTSIKFADVEEAYKVLKELNVKEFKTYPNGDVKIFDEIDLGSFVTKLNDKKLKILAINSSDEGVEEYYLNLVKGGNK